MGGGGGAAMGAASALSTPARCLSKINCSLPACSVNFCMKFFSLWYGVAILTWYCTRTRTGASGGDGAAGAGDPSGAAADDLSSATILLSIPLL